MKKFFNEFKKFITRGNVLDMAVGVIVGSSFTAIVNALSNNILKPLINYLLALVFGANSLNELFTFLKKVEVDGVVDLTQSIYIDWGTFINAIINFLLVAFVLFSIVKIMNKLRESGNKLEKALTKGIITKEDKKALKKAGIKLSNKEAVNKYFEEKKAKEDEEKAKFEAEAAEKARIEKEANPSTEELLKQIITILKKEA